MGSKMRLIDLTRYFNDTLVFNKPPSYETAAEKEWIVCDKVDFMKDASEEFKSVYGSHSGADNVICGGQSVFVGDKINGIVFYGFSSAEAVMEHATVRFYGGKTEKVKITLLGCDQKGLCAAPSETLFKGVSCARVLATKRRDGLPFYAYKCESFICGKDVVETITLPDNMFLHLFAIETKKS